jgi:ribosomal protein S18 acetylase RimI-like enzyme
LLEIYNQEHHSPAAVKELLALAVGRPEPDYLQKLLDRFYSTEGHTLFLTLDNQKIIGIIGVDNTAAPYGWITHIAVHQDYQKRGIGESIINQATDALALTSVGLETDQDALYFYRAIGFTCVEVYSQWPGVHRYRCTRGQWPQSVLEYYDNLEHQNKV